MSEITLRPSGEEIFAMTKNEPVQMITRIPANLGRVVNLVEIADGGHLQW
jgi:hypothetical protein